MSHTELKFALRKIKVVFQKPKLEVVFQIRLYLKKTTNQDCQKKTYCKLLQTIPNCDFFTNGQTDLKQF